MHWYRKIFMIRIMHMVCPRLHKCAHILRCVKASAIKRHVRNWSCRLPLRRETRAVFLSQEDDSFHYISFCTLRFFFFFLQHIKKKGRNKAEWWRAGSDSPGVSQMVSGWAWPPEPWLSAQYSFHGSSIYIDSLILYTSLNTRHPQWSLLEKLHQLPQLHDFVS